MSTLFSDKAKDVRSTGFSPQKSSLTFTPIKPVQLSLIDSNSSTSKVLTSILDEKSVLSERNKISQTPKFGPYVPPHRMTPSSINSSSTSRLSPFTPYNRSNGLVNEDSFYSNNSSNYSSASFRSPPSFSNRKKSSVTSIETPPSLFEKVPRSLNQGFIHPRTLLSGTKYPITIQMDRGSRRSSLISEDDQSFYSDTQELSSYPTSVVDGYEIDQVQARNSVISRKQKSLIEALDLPSPVWEVDENLEDKRNQAINLVHQQYDEVENPDVCTGCGTEPVASFVALIPCDHLICHTCINALVNSVAHTPPRPMVCFACGIPLESFGPAFEESESGLGMVNNLLLGLKNKDSARIKESKNEKIDLGQRREKQRKSRTVNNENTYIFGNDFSSTRRQLNLSSTSDDQLKIKPTRSNSASSSGISTPHIVSPLSLRYSSSNSTGKFRTPGGSTSVKKDLFGGLGDNSGMNDLSPYRNLDWSAETEASPSRYFESPTPHSTVPIKNTFKETAIPNPTEWAVIRIDNIPWDVTVPELEEWLPQNCLASSDTCVLPVHILCNRADGRTLNQCYIEIISISIARNIVRTKDGKKIRGRPVHVTLSNQGQLMTEIFPGWLTGFKGLKAIPGKMTGPLLVQTELTGLLSLCKLETSHACKVKERPYYNIVTILQKFPWHQTETYNSKQIVRLFNTSCAAVEILSTVRNEVPEWVEILTTMVAAVTACPVFRPSQKTKFVQLTGLTHSKYSTSSGLQSKFNFPKGKAMFDKTNTFSFSPPSLQESFVTVGNERKIFDGSENESPSKIFNVIPPGHHRKFSSGFSFVSQESIITSTPTISPIKLIKSTSSSPNLFSSTKVKKSPSPIQKRPRRLSSVSRQLGIDISMVKAVASELGITLVS